EFFQRPDKGLWGTAEAFRRGGPHFWFLFSHVAGYTSHPANPGGMFFDPDTMDAPFNTPGWVRGLEESIRASKLAPPNAL
ncbi:ABC transporter substrate-binding protein, partial [Rhizobium ruizarguesonis]